MGIGDALLAFIAALIFLSVLAGIVKIAEKAKMRKYKKWSEEAKAKRIRKEQVTPSE